MHVKFLLQFIVILIFMNFFCRQIGVILILYFTFFDNLFINVYRREKNIDTGHRILRSMCLMTLV